MSDTIIAIQLLEGIRNLQQIIAEKDAVIEKLDDALSCKNAIKEDLEAEIKQLKQQLAETTENKDE